MSAWLVTQGHIDILVNALVQYEVAKKGVTSRTLDNYGTELWRTNNRSVNHRYDEKNRLPRYEATLVTIKLKPEAVLRALDSWEYQSCEKPGWEDSRGGRLAARLREAIKAEHPAFFEMVHSPYSGSSDRKVPTYRLAKAYREASWSPDSVFEAVRTYSSPREV